MKLHLNKNYFLFFIMLVFIFVSTTAMSLAKNQSNDSGSFPKIQISYKNFPANPILKDGATFPILSAQGIIAVDLGSGISLYEKNPDASFLPASTTKILTALVALDTYSLDQIITIPKGVSVDGQKMGLYPGEQMKVEDLLYGLLVYSANDAAMALAIEYPTQASGSANGYNSFIEAMNQKAKDLSMTSSYFENPVGLDGNNQITTARDLMRASEIAMRNTEFVKIVGTKSITLTDVTGKSKYNLKNINELLGQVPGVLGIKTGWTENARENLVTYLDRDGHKIIIVMLGSQGRFGETKQIINWIFENYEWQEVKVPSLTALDNNRQLRPVYMP
jgi:D-alanyl-D-alanine carboxypeptidase (penicillin-binding protein 5/6)